MDRQLDKENMDQAKGYENVRYTSPDPRDEGLGSMNQRFPHDSSTNFNTNVRPPDYAISTPARPVLNYSIQTGEEFAFEFMRDRVVMKPQFIPNVYGDPSGMPVPVNLTAMGMVHPMSESGSKATEDKRHAFEQERKPPSRIEDKTYHELAQSAPVTSSRNDTGQRRPSLVSSRASDSSLNLAKFLCSFGGKIIPRPRDQKLRYVGGETRIIRISKTISFQELMHKMKEMFPEARTVKYQLPGEDLDALVSVSSDEDLQNMMEECIVFGNGGSEKPRMFLFSSSDVEEAQFVIEHADGDSEVQYVVAVNGMDLSSRKSSLGISAPGNNLDELLQGSIDRKINRATTEPAVASVAPLPGNESLSASQASQLVTGLSTGNEPFPQPYLGQQLHFTGLGSHQVYTSAHMANIAYIDEKGSASLHVQPQPHYIPYSVNPETPLAPHYPQKPEQGVSREEQIFHVQDPEPEASSKEAKMRRDDSFQKVNDPANVSTDESNLSAKEPKMKRESSTPRVSEYSVSSMPDDLIVPDHLVKEEAPIATQTSSSTPDISSSALPEKSLRKSQDHVENNLSAKEPKMKKGQTTRVNEYSVSSVSTDSKVPDLALKEEAPVSMKSSNSTPDPKSFVYPEKNLRTSQDYVPKAGALATASESMTNNQDNPFCLPGGLSASGHGTSDGNSSNLSNVDQPVIHPRVFHSERTLRDPAETNRLSKSDDSLASQFVMAHNTSDAFLPISESSETSHEANMESQNVHSTAPVRSAPESIWTAEGSMAQSEKRNLEPNASEHVSQTKTSLKAVPRGHTEKGDIVVDINDRFPREFLADILKAEESFPELEPLHADGAGVSLNIQNNDPKTWSYFRNLAQDEFERKDLSLMDQDHPGFPTSLTNTNGVPIDYSYPPLQSEKVASSQINSQIHFDGNIQPDVSTTTIANLNTVDTHEDYSQSQIKGAESIDTTLNTGVPLIDFMVADSGMRSLQVIKNDDLEELKELGSGTFGTVYHGKWRGTDVAIKRIKRSCFIGRSSEQERLTSEFWHEAEILSKLHHPNVMAFYGVVKDGPGGTLATVTEYMVNGSLRHVLLSNRHLDRRKRLIIAMDAAFGMEYLHSKSIVHFDLKCDNLLVNLKDPARPICKVGDFGLSKIKRNTLVTGGVRGTLPWMAPELLSGSSSKVSEKVDVFSFGIVLWEILTGEEPYANMHYGAIIGGIVNNTLRPTVPNYCDPEWRMLMEQCWAPDPFVRPAFPEIARRLRTMSSSAVHTKPHAVNHQIHK
ncbi:PREDICTED: dual specificity protein kinase splB-like [Camelina sativa]|uniref:Dual specificity protein kinase splB-like n=1 Tax=Camelina sativa TaxID=90675 RepID=A0ABM0ZJL9_CAMSA|nr:PREDICTED: dual specificity protein kinase splB-like [Camelina sativa]XP_010516677.1 PREDICTED: dual specificity protein kinase splB-like [Camelina sativa]